MFVGEKHAASAGRLSPVPLKAAVPLLALWLVLHAREAQQTPHKQQGGGGESFLEPALGSSLMAGAFGEQGFHREKGS